ncbi:hypothetical protein B843_00170 [Corynebacterium vitaeruminis DSM 20294]|uniref:Uncharacterized protein n=1 Tax=Corynebacterium vitaeruminis DSM 20294 TaxID=1224164 RepID=W5XXN3_9CORY|nr:hypothetical protein B843_00170 [Corynebacterium vitaeruminis DSM 20294]
MKPERETCSTSYFLPSRGFFFMFGLPLLTVAILGAVGIFWILYTAVFMFVSRDWAAEEEQ